MKQRDLDRLRKGVDPEFCHLLGEVDEEEGEVSENEVRQDDGFLKTLETICIPRSDAPPLPLAQDIELQNFLKETFPLPSPQRGPHQPGPASPTGRPTGVPHPVTPPSPKKSLERVGHEEIYQALRSGDLEPKAVALSMTASLLKEFRPELSEEKSLDEAHASAIRLGLQRLYEAVKEGSTESLMAAIRSWKDIRRELGAFA
jgi:hypothetical protein